MNYLADYLSFIVPYTIIAPIISGILCFIFSNKLNNYQTSQILVQNDENVHKITKSYLHFKNKNVK
jgi:hypothetical protein